MSYNNVVFSGDPAAVKDVRALFAALQEHEEQNIMPWVVSPPIEKNGYMDNLWQKDETVHFRTRWRPNLDMLAAIMSSTPVCLASDLH